MLPMNYNQMVNPYQSQMNQYPNFSQSYGVNNQSLVRVTGIEGAKAYQMGANSVVALFDSNEDLMYIKTTDGAGFGSIRTFKFEELHNLCKNQDYNVQTEQFVTKKEMEDYVKLIISNKQNSGKSEHNRQSKNADE